MTSIRGLSLLAASALALLSGCAVGDGAGWGSSYSPSATSGSNSSTTPSSSSASSATSGTTTSTAGRQASERTILNRDGSVTIIQRDPDGTRTIVDSKGNVRVDPPGTGSGYGSHHRRR
ncbi:MAG: hypothetical protein HZC25_02655 [Rhodospirillales bacterium]|nr:hypothetical protein [Rhodospirillales bacterium]